MARNLKIGYYYKSTHSPNSETEPLLYYVTKDHLVEVNVKKSSITAHSYEKTSSYNGMEHVKKFRKVFNDEQVKASSFFEGSEDHWYSSDAEEFTEAFNDVLHNCEALKHTSMKKLMDSSKEIISIEDFRNH